MVAAAAPVSAADHTSPATGTPARVRMATAAARTVMLPLPALPPGAGTTKPARLKAMPSRFATTSARCRRQRPGRRGGVERVRELARHAAAGVAARHAAAENAPRRSPATRSRRPAARPPIHREACAAVAGVLAVPLEGSAGLKLPTALKSASRFTRTSGALAYGHVRGALPVASTEPATAWRRSRPNDSTV